jgi:L-alanine-DL-glutamate epimerase-like enolase superfamily enzyme
MKVADVQVLRRVTPLPHPWTPAWLGAKEEAITSLEFSTYKICTDEGIVGIGPYTGMEDPSFMIGWDPFQVGDFWQRYVGGQGEVHCAAGLEIACWDIVGKAVNMPIYKLLGAYRNRIPVYAATSRILAKEQHIDQVQELADKGFKAVKIRLHRPDPREDLAVLQAIRGAVDSELMIMVDANQDNMPLKYEPWSRETALWMAKELEKLGVYFLEEPLPRADVDGLSALTASAEIAIAGGEHSTTIYDFREHVVKGAYDILQPDVVLTGHTGIAGMTRLTATAQYFGRQVIPHVVSNGNFPLACAATLHSMASAWNCPMVEYPYDPPILTAETLQPFIEEPFLIDKDGCIALPDRPGLGCSIIE